MRPLTLLETRPVRDLMVIQVPDEWSLITDDAKVKARLEREAMLLMLTQQVATEVNGQSRTIPPILGVLRDFKTDLIRSRADAEAVVVEHGDCTDCTDVMAMLVHAAEIGDLPSGGVGVIQFTFDEIVKAEFDA